MRRTGGIARRGGRRGEARTRSCWVVVVPPSINTPRRWAAPPPHSSPRPPRDAPPLARRGAIAMLLAKSSRVSLASVRAGKKEREKGLKRCGATENPEAVWRGRGVRNIEAASLAPGREFVALAKGGK